MTESEAIKWQESFKKTYKGFPNDVDDACDMAIKALEEIKMYHDGKLCLVPMGTLERQSKELDEYKEIGTVEECRSAVEKQNAKKVNLRHIRKYDGFDDGECPTCGMSVSRDCDGSDISCPDCGQKLDWSDSD